MVLIPVCQLVLIIALIVCLGLAIEKEWYSVNRRERLIEDAVDDMKKRPEACAKICNNLMELDGSVVVWRASFIAAFILASLGAMISNVCTPGLAVFVCLFFASLCVFYLKSGFDRSHVTGPLFAALRLSARLQNGEKPDSLMPRQL